MTSISINPATGEELGCFEDQTDAQIDAALDAAVTAQAAWREKPVGERVMLLRAIASALRAGAAQYARIITAEMGKPLAEALAEIEKCAVNCDYYAEHAPVFLADATIPSGAQFSAAVFDPLGVVLAVMPWNFPFWQFFRFAAPALAAGNGIILKHAANVPQCVLAIRQIMADAGAPRGLCGALLVGTEPVTRMLGDPRIAAVTLTGSSRVGSIIASEAGRHLKKQVLELGGSDPFIVLADADIARAAKVAVQSRFRNCGQSCIAAKRFIVVEAVADAFVEAFTAETAKLKLGDPAQDGVTIGPLARADLRDALHGQVTRSIKAGAKLIAGGKPVDGPGWFYQPTILDHVMPGMAVFEEETFGPAAAIIRARNTDEAIMLANATQFGLGAALWTADIEAAKSLARRIQAGSVFVNAMVVSDPRLPFGGIKQSGYGRELSDFGIREFVNVKTLSIS